MRPYVILLNSISLDGRLDWFKGDAGQYYQIAGGMQLDATLTGADCLLAGGDDGEAPTEEVEKMEGAGWLVVTDSRGRISNWAKLRAMPYWKEIIVLCSNRTPSAYIDSLKLQGVEHIITGEDKVDLAAALERLRKKYGIKRLRVDSGGGLNSPLLRQGLVDEIVLLINPYLVGGRSPRSFFPAEDLTDERGIIKLRLVQSKRIGGGVELLRYQVENGPSHQP